MLFAPSPPLSMLAGDDEELNSASYNALKEYVRIQVPSTKQMQDLVLEVLQNEPSYYNIAGYSAYVSLSSGTCSPARQSSTSSGRRRQVCSRTQRRACRFAPFS